MNETESPTGYHSLYEAYYPQVLAYFVRRVGRGDAQDLAAEVFAVAWRRREVVPGGDGALPWLYGTAYRIVSHHWRSTDRRRRLGSKLAALPAPLTNQPDAQVVQHHDYAMVIEALKRLRPVDQEVLRLAVWEELTHDQIAASLGVTSAAVRQRFHRAKRALLKEFERSNGPVPSPSVAQEGGEQ